MYEHVRYFLKLHAHAHLFSSRTRGCVSVRRTSGYDTTRNKEPARRDSENDVCGGEGMKTCVKNRERKSEWAYARKGKKESEMNECFIRPCVWAKKKFKEPSDTRMRATKEIERRSKERMIDKIETTVLDRYFHWWFFFLFLSSKEEGAGNI